MSSKRVEEVAEEIFDQKPMPNPGSRGPSWLFSASMKDWVPYQRVFEALHNSYLPTLSTKAASGKFKEAEKDIHKELLGRNQMLLVKPSDSLGLMSAETYEKWALDKWIDLTASQRQLKLGFSLQVPTETLEAERQARKEVVRLHSSILLLAASAQAAPEIGEAMAAISHTLLPNLFNRTKEWLHCKFQCRYAALQLQKTHPGICFLQSNPWNWTFHLRSLGELILRRLRDKKQTLEAKHIKGSFNVLSDQLSRNTTISTEWSLPQTTFDREIQRKFPSLKWDMFATSLNRKLPKFVSPCPDQGAMVIDALTLDWSHMEGLYLFPPTPLVSKVVGKWLASKPRITILVTGFWPARPWFARHL